MKIRHGFVSNSSTTSFCIMGDWLDPPEEMDDFWEVCEEGGLEVHKPEGCSEYAVGLSYDAMKEDETKAQFRKRVTDLIFKVTGQTVDPGTIEEAYYS